MGRAVKVVVNALQYKQNSSGIGVMLRELFGRYVRMTTRHCQIILPQDGPDFPAEPEIIRAPWDHGQNLRRMFFQTFLLGQKYCRDAVLLTSDSKVPFFLPKNCFLIPIITDLAVYRLKETYQFSVCSGGACNTGMSAVGQICFSPYLNLPSRK